MVKRNVSYTRVDSPGAIDMSKAFSENPMIAIGFCLYNAQSQTRDFGFEVLDCFTVQPPIYIACTDE
jgi:hypothetical protein